MEDVLEGIFDEQNQTPEGDEKDVIEDVISDAQPAEVGETVKEEGNPVDGEEQGTEPKPKPSTTEPEPDFLTTYFPEFKSVDEVKTAVDSFKEENEKLKGELEKLKGSLKGFDSGINPDYMRLQKIEKENPKIAPVYKQMLMGSMSNNELLKMSLVMEDPDLAEDQEMLEMRLEDKYPVLFDEDADPDSDEYKKAMKKVTYDAKKAESKIKSEFEKIDVPMPETTESRKEKVEKVLKTWDGFDFKNKELTTVKVSLDGEDSPVHFMDIDIPEKDKVPLLKEAMQYMVENGVEKSKDSVQQLQNYVAGMWIGRNLAKYNRMIIDRRAQMSEREWRERVHNPKPQKQNVNTQPQGDVVMDILNDM
jgi:hypothetical protein